MKLFPIGALAGWYGSKGEMAPTIVGWLGEHRSYVEPFCGGMAVLLAKPPCTSEIVNDLHGDLTNLAWTIQHDVWGVWLYRRLRRTLYSEASFDFARWKIDELPSANGPDCLSEDTARRAFYYFILCWMGRRGTLGTRGNNPSFTVRYGHTGGNQATRFAAALGCIPAWRKRMRGVTIMRRDGFQLLERLPDATLQSIYVDPPYLIKDARYLHDFADDDHERLATMLRRFRRCRVVVSYYDHPELARLYPEKNWLRVDCKREKRLSRQTATEGDKYSTVPELLFVNRSSINA